MLFQSTSSFFFTRALTTHLLVLLRCIEQVRLPQFPGHFGRQAPRPRPPTPLPLEPASPFPPFFLLVEVHVELALGTVDIVDARAVEGRLLLLFGGLAWTPGKSWNTKLTMM